MEDYSIEDIQEIVPISSPTGGASEQIWSYESFVSAGTMTAILIGMFVLFIATYIVNAVFLGKIFKKAGVPAWQAWVPILNSWKILEIGGQQGYWAILAFIPLVNIVSAVFTIIAIYNINLKLKYGAGMTVLAIIFPLIWVIIAGTSTEQWDDSLGAASLAKETVTPAAVTPETTAPEVVAQDPVAPETAASETHPTE